MSSDLIAFLKQRETGKIVEFAACKDWKDEKGNPVMWKIKKLNSKELSDLRSAHARINHKKKDVETDEMALINTIAASCVVFPNLRDAKLADALFPDAPLDQRTPGNVLFAILSDDTEYQAFCKFVSDLHGWTETAENEQSALVEIAKNA